MVKTERVSFQVALESRRNEERLRVAIDVPPMPMKVLGLVMPMGPITLNDLVGLDTALYAGRVVNTAFAFFKAAAASASSLSCT